MIATFQPYSAYKASGVLWLGRVPAHWECLPHRAVFQEVLERDRPDEQMLSVTIGRGVIRQSDLLADTSKKDSSNTDKTKYKLVSPGDLAYNKMRAWQGAIGVSKYRGIISPAYIVVRPRKPQNTGYYHYLFRTPAFATEAERWSYGISSDQWSLRPEDFKRIYCVVPPSSEQDAIVQFLDCQDRLVGKYIRAKEKLIGLLNEQKQAIIQRAVTRGLNPDVRMKASGVDWLGDIPEQWEVRRAKFVFREVDERSTTGGEELLSVSHITGVTPRSQKSITMFKALSYVGHKLCRAGDLVINTMWAWMGALGVSKEIGIVSPSYAVYRPLEPSRLAGEYVDQLLRIPLYVVEYVNRSRGIRSSRLRLYPDQFFCIPLVLPPVEEQRTVAASVRAATSGLDNSISGAERQISLMREYRTRLIADVVTGRIDMRELPVEEVERDVAAIAEGSEAGESEEEETPDAD